MTRFEYLTKGMSKEDAVRFVIDLVEEQEGNPCEQCVAAVGPGGCHGTDGCLRIIFEKYLMEPMETTTRISHAKTREDYRALEEHYTAMCESFSACLECPYRDTDNCKEEYFFEEVSEEDAIAAVSTEEEEDKENEDN